MSTTYIIRAGRGGVYAGEWLEAGVVGIGWDFGGADIASMTREQIHDAYVAAHPDKSRGKVAAAVAQVYKFAHDVEVGATVVMYDPSEREYHLGRVAGPCEPVKGKEGLAYSRKVEWGPAASRDALAQSSRNSLGGIATIFAVNADVLADLRAAAAKPHKQKGAQPKPFDPEEEGAEDEARYATYEDGIERIKDRVSELSWEDMEELTAGLLRAMGYHARVTAKGADGGRDVVASPDALGLESPHIVAEVKHRKGPMGAPAVRSFIGGLRSTDRGLYVSTGGFSKDARIEADRATIPVRLVDLDSFVRLYIESYDNMDEDARAILPLVRIWWPA